VETMLHIAVPLILALVPIGDRQFCAEWSGAPVCGTEAQFKDFLLAACSYVPPNTRDERIMAAATCTAARDLLANVRRQKGKN
jgi:hypothetical protein